MPSFVNSVLCGFKYIKNIPYLYHHCGKLPTLCCVICKFDKDVDDEAALAEVDGLRGSHGTDPC